MFAKVCVYYTMHLRALNPVLEQCEATLVVVFAGVIIILGMPFIHKVHDVSRGGWKQSFYDQNKSVSFVNY
jgi:hypothetical protein